VTSAGFRRMTAVCGMRYAVCATGRVYARRAAAAWREQLRLQAAKRFARGDGINEIALDLGVTEGSVRRWHRAWQAGGPEALRSKGPVSRERLGDEPTPRQKRPRAEARQKPATACAVRWVVPCGRQRPRYVKWTASWPDTEQRGDLCRVCS
jgi:transposase-like protein